MPDSEPKAGEPAKLVPGSTRFPPPADPTYPDSPPAQTGLDSSEEERKAMKEEIEKAAEIKGPTNAGIPSPEKKK